MPTEVTLQIRGDVQRLHLQPGDIVAIMLQDHIDAGDAERMLEHLRSIFVGHQVIAFSKGVQIGVIGARDEH